MRMCCSLHCIDRCSFMGYTITLPLFFLVVFSLQLLLKAILRAMCMARWRMSSTSSPVTTSGYLPMRTCSLLCLLLPHLYHKLLHTFDIVELLDYWRLMSRPIYHKQDNDSMNIAWLLHPCCQYGHTHARMCRILYSSVKKNCWPKLWRVKKSVQTRVVFTCKLVSGRHLLSVLVAE